MLICGRNRHHLHATGSPGMFRRFSYWIEVFHTAQRESNALCFNNSVQLYSASSSGTESDPVQSILVRFTCKYRNPISNAHQAFGRYNLFHSLNHIFDSKQLHWTVFKASCKHVHTRAFRYRIYKNDPA